MEEKNNKKKVMIIIAIVLVIWFALGVFPIKPIAIATGSMEKEICVGDVAIIQKFIMIYLHVSLKSVIFAEKNV